jgi:chromosome segregation ATPase
LGSRSYAIIEQGMISRVIEAKADDMRSFVEEAAGISRYKERRKETEARIADTRENLERLQDVRDEVDKQIRHLQRQAATARRYQVLKETERRLTAELLALRLREIDSGSEVQDSAVRECELRMQQALADQRAAEAAIETQRVYQNEQSERVSAVQARYYEIGAEISRTEQSITHTRELRDQQRNELATARATLAELESHISRDEREIASLRAEIERLSPDLAQAQTAEGVLAEELASAEESLADWQQRWEGFNREQGAAHQTTQVERARIEQLENQLRRLAGQTDRLAIERETLMAQESSALLGQLTQKESLARSSADELSQALNQALDRSQKLRAAQFEAETRLAWKPRVLIVSVAVQKWCPSKRCRRRPCNVATRARPSGSIPPGLASSLGSLPSCRSAAAGSARSKRRSATIWKPFAWTSSMRSPTCCPLCRSVACRCCRPARTWRPTAASACCRASSVDPPPSCGCCRACDSRRISPTRCGCAASSPTMNR